MCEKDKRAETSSEAKDDVNGVRESGILALTKYSMYNQNSINSILLAVTRVFDTPVCTQ
jgi:hypothetical protein